MTYKDNNTLFITDSKNQEIQDIIKLLIKEKLPTEGVEKNISNFLSLYINDKLIGTIGLEIYDNKGLLRSLVIDEFYQGKGYGKILCNKLFEKARQKKINELFLLTETAPKFFLTIGFKKIPRESADEKVKTSDEFKSICPSTAVCMQLKLS